MFKLYDYTNEKMTILESFDSWLDAKKALDSFKKNNPDRLGFIAGRVKGKLKIDNADCPVSIMDLMNL